MVSGAPLATMGKEILPSESLLTINFFLSIYKHLLEGTVVSNPLTAGVLGQTRHAGEHMPSPAQLANQ